MELGFRRFAAVWFRVAFGNDLSVLARRQDETRSTKAKRGTTRTRVMNATPSPHAARHRTEPEIR
jgi:hypothetical protein